MSSPNRTVTTTDLRRYRPLPPSAVAITGGPWAQRQVTNSQVSLHHGLEMLRRSGVIANFESLARGVDGEHGHAGAFDEDAKNFVDSDAYKWLEAVAWAGVAEPLDPSLESSASELIDLIVDAQDDDGYLNTWFQRQPREQRFTNLAFGHELYCLGHLIQAAVAWDRNVGDSRLTGAAIAFADLVVRVFAEPSLLCGHPGVEMALTELARHTGQSRYARLATELIDRRGAGLLGAGRFGARYYQDDRPYREMSTLSGHAVRAVYLAAGAVDVAVLNGDEQLLEATRVQWRNVTTKRMYVTGAIGSRHLGESFGDDYELPSDAAYCESCASVGLAMWTWRLGQVELHGAYGDLIERIMYNGVFGAVSDDGCAFSYTNPLEVHEGQPLREWFEIACCPPNVMRTVAALAQFVATESDRGMQIHQWVPARIDAGGERVVETSGRYPDEGRFRIQIMSAPSGRWVVSVRVPSWADDCTVRVNGRSEPHVVTDGYLNIDREWQVGDSIELFAQLDVRLTRANPRVGLGGAVAVERGPVVYCLSEAHSNIGHPGSVMLADALVPATIHRHDRAIPDIELETICPDFGTTTYASTVTARAAMPTTRATFIPFASARSRRPNALRVWVPTV